MTPNDIWKQVDGWAWQIKSEFVELLKFIQDKRVGLLLETGTNKGGTSYAFCLAGCSVVSLDIVSYAEVRRVEKDFSNTFAAVIADSKSHKTNTIYDMLFIDGDHSYEGVKADYDNFIGNVRPGGFVAFHDIKDSHLHRKQNCWVSRFWQEIRGENYVEFCDTREEWGGIGVKFL